VGRFVLVHGAWHGGWCFERLTRELTARGHEVAAPDLPCDDLRQDQHSYARLVGPQPDAVVVGHSLGGLTIPLLEARIRVYLAAILPVENVYADSLAPGFGSLERDELGRSYWPELEDAASRLYADCDRATVEWAFPRLRRQAPLAPQTSAAGPRDVSIACLRDRIVDPGWQLAAGARHVPRVIELDAGHFPMLTHPVQLADVLESLA
jgi:pimeloyl-ACP methyl ester carboxylesterase